MKTKITLLIAVLCLLCLTVCACSGEIDAVNDAQKKAINTFNSLQISATVTDSDTVVYKYGKNYSVDEQSVNVTTTESKLNDNFQLEDNTTDEELVLNRSAFKSVNLSGKLVFEVTSENGVTTCKISKENLSEVLGADVVSSGDANVTAKITDGVLDTLTIVFDTVSGKTVTIEYVYSC